MVKIIKDYYTKNRCYTNNRNYKKIGGIVHSTATPGVMAKAFRDRWNNATMNPPKAVHAFVDDTIAIECLPDTREAWHVATHTGNRYYYGFEICEDRNHDRDYFIKAYNNAVFFAAAISRRKGWSGNDWLSHKEANKKGFASNHGDPEHWFSKFGYTMNDFRRSVDVALSLLRPLVIGDKGIAVKELQTDLEELGYSIVSDGSYGPKTRDTVTQFQKDNNLIVDGIAGPQTQGKIAELLLIKRNPPTIVNRVPDGKILRIRAGAFSVYENAEKQLAEIQGAGFKDAYLKLEDR